MNLPINITSDCTLFAYRFPFKDDMYPYHIMEVLLARTYFFGLIKRKDRWFRQHINSDLPYWVRSDIYTTYEPYGDQHGNKYYINKGHVVDDFLNKFFIDKFYYYNSTQYKIDKRVRKIDKLLNSFNI